MKKKTKELLIKIGVGLTAVLGSGFLLFGKKNNEKEVEMTSKVNKKDIGDGDLFI